jgi:hypothetical protein
LALDRHSKALATVFVAHCQDAELIMGVVLDEIVGR